jgi:hypothetical protein
MGVKPGLWMQLALAIFGLESGCRSQGDRSLAGQLPAWELHRLLYKQLLGHIIDIGVDLNILEILLYMYIHSSMVDANPKQH